MCDYMNQANLYVRKRFNSPKMVLQLFFQSVQKPASQLHSI